MDVGTTAFGLHAIYIAGHVFHTISTARRVQFKSGQSLGVVKLLPCLGCGNLDSMEWCPRPLEDF
jgi:hypothetical protein